MRYRRSVGLGSDFFAQMPDVYSGLRVALDWARAIL